MKMNFRIHHSTNADGYKPWFGRSAPDFPTVVEAQQWCNKAFNDGTAMP